MTTSLFEQIKGHSSIKKRLSIALEGERLAHSLLFSGPSGIGKKQMAFALAQKLLCDDSSACGKCYSCIHVASNESEHILFISSEKMQITMDDIQDIHSFLSLGTDKFKIVIIESSEKLNSRSANSLLKILEEPPSKSFFFFVSSEPSKLPITIRSRLQNIRFNPLPLDLVKSISSAEDWLVAASQGRLDRLGELQDQKELRETAFNLWEFVSNKGLQAPAIVFPDILKKRKEALVISQYWQQILRDARFMKIGENNGFIHIDQKPLISQISQFSVFQLDELIKSALELERNLKSNIDCILCFEYFVIALQRLQKD